MNRKTHCKIVILIHILTAVFLCITGCSFDLHDTEIGIYTLKIDAATGDRENNNCVGLVNDGGSGGPYKESNFSLMTGEAAMQLIKEINVLPEISGDEKDPFAFYIRLQYYDDDHNLILTEKTGYGGFPDNWEKIVSYTNEISENKKLTDSRDIVIIDADHLRNVFGLTDDMLPDGVSVEKYLEDTGLTYADLYSPYFRIENSIRDYSYKYYDLASNRIKEDTSASVSGYASLKEYAEDKLDSIDASGDMSIAGDFRGYRFEIVRFDCFEDWKNNNSVDGIETASDGTIDIYYMRNVGPEGMTCAEPHYVYVDPSSRFLSITQCEDYDVINAYLER